MSQIEEFFESIGHTVSGDRINPCPFCGSDGNALQIKSPTSVQCFNPSCVANNRLSLSQVAEMLGQKISVREEEKIKPGIKPLFIATEGTQPKVYTRSKQINRKMYDIAADFYHRKLKESKSDLSYQIEQKKHSSDIIDEFRVGIVKDWDKLYNQLVHLYGEDEVEDSGLFKFTDTLESSSIWGYTYPITWEGETWSIKTKLTTANGDKIGTWIKREYSGTDFPPILNASILSDKSVNEIWVVEGENDCLAMIDQGYRNTIAMLGSFGKDEMSWLNNREKTQYILAMDNDEAGKEHIKKFIKLLDKKHSVKLLKYESKDPYDAIKSTEPEILNRFIEENEIQFETQKIKERKTFTNYESFEITTGKKTTTAIKAIEVVQEIPHIDEITDKFYSWSQGGDSKSILIFKDGFKAVRNKHHFSIILNYDDYIVSFKDGLDVKLDGVIEHLCDTCKVIDRITTVREYPRSDRTLYTGENEVPAQKNGMFRKLIETFSLKDIRAQYRLASSVLSFFLGEEFDSLKPLFDVTADGTSAGKTSVIVALIKIVLRQVVMMFEGTDRDDEMINSFSKAKLCADLCDNINARVLRSNGHGIIRRVTDPELKLWIMGTSHGKIPNAFTHFGTFHGTEGMSMDNDFQARHLNIEMTSGSERSFEERIQIPKKLKEFELKHNEVLADIYWIMENPSPPDYNVLPHTKCARWSDHISAYLKTMFPEVNEFDFQPLESDIELDDERTSALEILEKWWSSGASSHGGVFVRSDTIMDSCREKLGENHWACKNRLSPSKFFRNQIQKIDGWDIDFRTRDTIEGEGQTRGWTIKKL